MPMDNNTGLSEGLTDAERAYFSSGGEDTAALEQQIASETSGTAPPAAGDAAPAPGAPGAPEIQEQVLALERVQGQLHRSIVQVRKGKVRGFAPELGAGGALHKRIGTLGRWTVRELPL